MKVRDILNQKHTMLYTISGYTNNNCYKQIDEKLYSLIVTIPNMIKDKIFKLRELGYDTDDYKREKKHYPNWVVSGTYPFKEINDNSTIEWSNIISIDIDKHDNKDIDLDNIRQKIFDLPYVFAVLKSISGLGLYALVLVEDGHYTKEYYKYLAKLWNQKYGLEIDTQCDNISRKRFIGYDENVIQWIKQDNIDIVPWKLKWIEKEHEKPKQTCLFNESKDDNLVRKAIWKLLNNGYSIDNMNTSSTTRYGTWYHIACDFHHFDDGYDMFVKFSQNSSKYHDSLKNIEKKYNNGKIENTLDDVSKKWCGICKKIYGIKWWKN